MADGGALVGRQAEVASLDAALDRLPSGSGLLVEVAGELGIGKSRLLAELRRRANERGYVVLSGRAAQLEYEPPFAPFVAALDPYLRTLAPGFLEGLGPQVVAELATVFPFLGDRGGAQDAALQAERFRTHHAVGLLVA